MLKWAEEDLGWHPEWSLLGTERRAQRIQPYLSRARDRLVTCCLGACPVPPPPPGLLFRSSLGEGFLFVACFRFHLPFSG